MKSKRTRKRAIPQPNQKVDENNSCQRKPFARGPKPLVASDIFVNTKLALPLIKRLLRCYAEALSASEAAGLTKLSLVTTYKLYELIRLRLYFVGIYKSYRQHATEIADRDAHTDSGPGLSTTGLQSFIRAYVRRHRGASSALESLFVAEAAFRYRAEFTTDQFYKLLILAIRGSGPLNRAPTRYDPVPLATYICGIRVDLLHRQGRAVPWSGDAFPLPMAMTEIMSAMIRDQLAIFTAEVAEGGYDPAHAPGASGWRPPGRPDLITPVPHPDDDLPIGRKAEAAFAASRRSHMATLRERLFVERERRKAESAGQADTNRDDP